MSGQALKELPRAIKDIPLRAVDLKCCLQGSPVVWGKSGGAVNRQRVRDAVESQGTVSLQVLASRGFSTDFPGFKLEPHFPLPDFLQASRLQAPREIQKPG